MKAWKLLLGMVFTLLLLPSVMAQPKPSSMSAPTPAGNWTTIDDKTGDKRALVNLIVKNGTLSGTILKVYPQPGDTGICSKCTGRFKDKPFIGMEFLWGLKEKSPGSWYGGQILDGRSGKIYRVKIALKGDKLYVRGYVGLSMMGRTQVWVRA